MEAFRSKPRRDSDLFRPDAGDFDLHDMFHLFQNAAEPLQ
jgi:hypothetical protein